MSISSVFVKYALPSERRILYTSKKAVIIKTLQTLKRFVEVASKVRVLSEGAFWSILLDSSLPRKETDGLIQTISQTARRV